jgi:NAD(P)-dependent dehydrogenase (short-subunit alcohol dehydrogenase family)
MGKLEGRTLFVADRFSRTGKDCEVLFAQEGAVIMEHGREGFDFANPAAIRDDAETALQKYGTPDIFIHNINETGHIPLETASEEMFEHSLAVNLKSAYYYLRVFGPRMEEAKKGSVIFISTIHDEKPNGTDFAYSASKGALKMFMRELTLELRPFGAHVNMIEMGPLAGEEQTLLGDLSPLYEFVDYRMDNTPAPSRTGYAEAALYLAADAPYANGAEIRLDGGILLSYIGGRGHKKEAIK